MRSSGALLIGAAVVGAGVLLFGSQSASAATLPPDETDTGPELSDAQHVMSYHAHALALPEDWTEGQLKSLENLLVEIGFTSEAADVHDLRVGMFGGDHPDVPADPLPPITILPEVDINAIVDTAHAQASGA